MQKSLDEALRQTTISFLRELGCDDEADAMEWPTGDPELADDETDVCICGHRIDEHLNRGPYDVCFGEPDETSRRCRCNQFVPSLV